MSFVLAYQWDMAYGTKIERIVADADRILMHEPRLLRMPGGRLSLTTIDAAVVAATTLTADTADTDPTSTILPAGGSATASASDRGAPPQRSGSRPV
jgi:hypothetical protein